jgi:hypothetical protein
MLGLLMQLRGGNDPDKMLEEDIYPLADLPPSK